MEGRCCPGMDQPQQLDAALDWWTSRELRSFRLRCSIYKRPTKLGIKQPILQVSITLFNPYTLLFLPALPGISKIPGLPPSVNRNFRKLNGGNQPFFIDTLRGGKPGRAPGNNSPKIQNPRKVPFIVGVWEFCTRPGPGDPQHKPPLPIKNR